MGKREAFNQRKESQQQRGDEEKIRHLTSHNLAHRYQVTERQICKLARIGYLPGFRVGKLWRFRKDTIEDWEKKQVPTNDIEKLADKILDKG